MATIIYTPGNRPTEVGFRVLLEEVEKRGHKVVVVDTSTTETLRDPLVTGVLREHALAEKDQSIFFMGATGDGSRAVRTAAEYLWKHGEPSVSGVILISPPVPVSVAPFRSVLSVGKTFLQNVVSGKSSLREEVQALVDTPLLLRTCMYPTLHFYSTSEGSVQQIFGHKLLAMSFTSSHPVRSSDGAILDSDEREAVIERITSWIDAIVLAGRPLKNMNGLTVEAR